MIKKELTVFVVVGVITVLIDFIVYNVLVEFRLSDVNVAKGVGFVSGTIFSYFMHHLIKSHSCIFNMFIGNANAKKL